MQLRIKDSSSLSLMDGITAKNDRRSFIKMITTILFRRKWLILAIFIFMSATGIAYAWLTPNRYRSVMKILVKNERVDAAVSAQEHSWADRSKVSEESINSEIELIRSRDLLQGVIEKLSFDLRPVEPGISGKILKRAARANSVMGMEGAIQNLQANLEVNPVKKADVIEIIYSDSSPEMAVAVLKQLADDYLNKHLSLHQTPGAHDFFKEQAETYRQQLLDAQAELTAFRKKNEVTDLETQKKLNLNYQADLEKLLLRTEVDVQDAAKKIDQLRRQINILPTRILTQSREIPNQFSVERLNTLLVELRNKRTQLLTKFHDTDRLVREVDNQIADTQNALATAEKYQAVEKQTDPNPIRQVLEPELYRTEAGLMGLRAQRDTLSSQLDDYRKKLTHLEDVTLINNELERNLKQAEENYRLYAKKEEEARIAEALDQQKIANVAIAEAPTFSLTPYKPNRSLTVALGILIGLFISLSLAFILEYFSDIVHSSEDLESLSGMPVLATLPNGNDYREIKIELINPIGFIPASDFEGPNF